jgi:hypothetical protein
VHDFENAREYSRVEAFVPFDVRLLSQDEYDTLRSRIAGEAFLPDLSDLTSPDDPHQPEWFTILNRKLDTILSLLTIHQGGFESLPCASIVISGSGMRFTSMKTFQPGDAVEIKLMLPLCPPIALHLIGQVVGSRETGDTVSTSVKFTVIDDIVRDMIIRYVFEREREMIREKRS